MEIITKTPGKKFRDTKVDMTPMVDLGFLLITFFIFNSVLSKPKAMKLVMPADGKPIDVPVSQTLTLLLKGNDQLAWYDDVPSVSTNLHTASISPTEDGLRNLIIQKQKKLRETFGTDKSMIVIIKPGDSTNYQELIATLDEMSINEVKKYAIAKMDDIDKVLLKSLGTKY